MNQSHLNWLTQVSSNGVTIAKPELVYYRGKTALLNLSPKKGLQAQLAGNYVSTIKGRGMEFDEVRHYQAGDDVRMIDWRVTARTGKTHTKLFREERERPVFVLTDLGESMQFGSQLLYKSVQAAHLAALIGWNVKQRGDRLGGLVFNQNQHMELKPRSRQAGVLQYIHALDALSKPTAEAAQTNFTDACARIRRLAKPGSMVVIISDFQNLTDAAVKHLSQISQHCELKTYRIYDPLELSLPSSNIKQSLQVSHQEKIGQIILGDAKNAASYQQEALKFMQAQQQKLQACRCKLIDISAAIPLEEQFK
ncbi:DUF58 domain-containing protein [Catenovulum maritimum]|uniref:DUF58 domain-containing protein n=1 Tax=Catenovulum maritimum TaxID=1513271 RepID=A0A0J8GSP6_9ALTE|nr:DUF58 domain-containing protein [Catenovulum maritimum]KMT65815.1 hypothetical protein XM47_07405 [Catenovulum maritimum]